MATPPSSRHTPIQVLVLGGLSYAGLAAATNLLDLSRGATSRFGPTSAIDALPSTADYPAIRITLVDERSGFYHLIGSPLALSERSYASKAWVPFDEIKAIQHPSINFIHGSVRNVNTTKKSARIARYLEKSSSAHPDIGGDFAEELELQYDYLLCATGLRRVFPVVPQSLVRQQYLTEAHDHIDRVQSSSHHGTVVIGGGAVGIEMAAEIKDVYPELKVTLVHSREHLLSSEPLPDEFKVKTLEVLRETGVEVIVGARVLGIEQPNTEDGRMPTLALSTGTTVQASHVINAISKAIPTSSYLPATYLDGEGYILIRPSLHFLNSTDTDNQSHKFDPYHLAAGDITSWPGIKRCGAAMHMGIFAGFNIHRHILSTLNSSSTHQRPSSPYASQASDSFNDIPTILEEEEQKSLLEYMELKAHEPMIGLAIGKTGTVYSPIEGTKAGPEVLKYMFGDDLGFSICWNYMRLGESPASSDLGMNKLGEVAAPEAPIALEEDGKGKVAGSISAAGDDAGQKTPTLSATGSTESEPEPQTPVDAVGNAGVTNFEALERDGKVIEGLEKVTICEKKGRQRSLEKIAEETESAAD